MKYTATFRVKCIAQMLILGKYTNPNKLERAKKIQSKYKKITKTK